METAMIVKALGFSGLAVVLVLAWRVLDWVWFTPRRLEKCLRKQGLKGTSYQFFYGDLKESAAMVEKATSKPMAFSHDICSRVLPSVYKSVNTHGNNSFMWTGRKPRVHVMDPGLVKDILSKYDDYQKYYKTSNPLIKLFIAGVISYEGQKWARHRAIMNPAFHLERLKYMLPAFYSSCVELLSKWEKIVPAEGQCELDLWPQFETLTSDVISRTAFGSSYEQGRKIFEILKEQAKLTLKAMESPFYIPGWRYLPTTWNRRMKSIYKQIHSMVGGMVKSRLNSMMEGTDSSEDLLGMLLRSNLKETKENGVGMTIDDIIAECRLFYFAGQETTAGLLTWTMTLLAKHQDWQTRAREEIFEIFGNRKPDYDGLSHLKIVTMILNEVLRLYPPVVELTRIVHEDTKLGDVTVPAGVQIMLPTMLIHHDREIWGDDATEFNPERFAEGVSKATKNQVCFIPFGWGPRICIAQNFAILEVKMALSLILPKFAFELSPSYAHAPYVVITLQPQYGAHVMVRRLQKQN